MFIETEKQITATYNFFKAEQRTSNSRYKVQSRQGAKACDAPVSEHVFR